ncbi:hypothetical protein UY3_17896 [Chelonia mydas]|uniref:Uncharacterized protein n=1 Tax=Chelonia mydas TaxID=8469 RepID=M7AQB4_CHEMY|nr:hypothetical protein UY3_17896 [Chelonia mydas]
MGAELVQAQAGLPDIWAVLPLDRLVPSELLPAAMLGVLFRHSQHRRRLRGCCRGGAPVGKKKGTALSGKQPIGSWGGSPWEQLLCSSTTVATGGKSKVTTGRKMIWCNPVVEVGNDKKKLGERHRASSALPLQKPSPAQQELFQGGLQEGGNVSKESGGTYYLPPPSRFFILVIWSP